MDEYSPEFCIRPPRDGGGGGGGGGGMKCGRWNPTSEQVKLLTELYRSGLRTPSTDQIQKISSELSFYGKIENKNVFYWFQNHKARERQKRRRVLADEVNHITTAKVSSTKRDDVRILEQERKIETLQLFPLNSFSTQASDHSEKLRLFNPNNYCKENNATSFACIVKEMDHPTLDLRLNFL